MGGEDAGSAGDDPPRTALSSAEGLAAAVVRTVASAADVEPLALPPLSAAVDPDALEALFASGPASDPGPMAVSFRYADHVVAVERDGELTVAVAAGE
ncbi:MAG: HalOD1 output domain-containing protein [Haloarculaceae archaeon]